MLEILRSDDINIEMYLGDNPAAEPGAFQLQGRGQRMVYSAAANEFIDVCIAIQNNTGKQEGLSVTMTSEYEADIISHSPALSLDMLVRLELRPPEAARSPVVAAAHLSRYLAVEGVSPVPVRTFAPGQSHTIRIPICFLAEGKFELGCVAEERDERSSQELSRDLKVASCKEPLVIDVDR